MTLLLPLYVLFRLIQSNAGVYQKANVSLFEVHVVSLSIAIICATPKKVTAEKEIFLEQQDILIRHSFFQFWEPILFVVLFGVAVVVVQFSMSGRTHSIIA